MYVYHSVEDYKHTVVEMIVFIVSKMLTRYVDYEKSDKAP